MNPTPSSHGARSTMDTFKISGETLYRWRKEGKVPLNGGNRRKEMEDRKEEVQAELIRKLEEDPLKHEPEIQQYDEKFR